MHNTSIHTGDVGVLARDKKGLTSLPRMGRLSPLTFHLLCCVIAAYATSRARTPTSPAPASVRVVCVKKGTSYWTPQ